jgi:hypothetical protein
VTTGRWQPFGPKKIKMKRGSYFQIQIKNSKKKKKVAEITISLAASVDGSVLMDVLIE